MRTLLFLVTAAACTREPARPADSPSGDPKPAVAPHAKEPAVNPLDALLLGSSDSLFLAQVDHAAAVFLGKLVEVGPPPAAFSGYQLAMQALTYEVVRVLHGDVAGPRFTVHHVMVAQSPALVDGKPQLKPESCEVGAEYLVAVGGTMEGKRVTANENVGPIKATPELVRQVEAKLAH
jgi:hypothetical protein